MILLIGSMKFFYKESEFPQWDYWIFEIYSLINWFEFSWDY